MTALNYTEGCQHFTSIEYKHLKEKDEEYIAHESES